MLEELAAHHRDQPGCRMSYALAGVGVWGAIIPSDEANPDSNHSGSSLVAPQALEELRKEGETSD
jgi:hypothetical protein